LRITERPSVIDNSGGDTDLDAGAQIAARHSDKLAWTPELGWLSWSGKRWETGAMAEASAAEWAKQEARRARQAAEAIQDEELRKRKVAAAKAREDMTRVEKALRSARTDTRLLRPVGSWDADPWLLTVENGTLDLRTGGLRPHSPADASTKLAPVYYNPDATHPVLEGYLADLDAQLAGFSSFLARCFGMALTGDVSAESVFILTGEGGSGKTTLLAAIAAILGEYAAKVAFEQLCASKYGRSGHSSELIRLRQVRLAYAAEGGASARLDEGRIKELTGDEAISAREVYKAQTEFQPRFKLWLVSNYDPRCEADDTGMWRRICKLSFQAIPETKRNIRIKETLRDDPGARSAVLAWCVRGCLDWQARGRGRRGLAIPGEVDVWTKGYQTSLDQLSLWWQEMTRPGGEYRLDPNGSVATAIVRGRYDAWAKDEGFPPVSPPRFNRHMKAVGLRKSTTKGAQAWMGVSRG
jgi:putative DNA primase/helicase